jgi:hypothetical protein
MQFLTLVISMSKKISFEEAFAQATNEALKILGVVVSKIVTDYLESKYCIRLTKTVNNPAALDEALEHAIDGGRTIVERKLINLLYEKLGLDLSLTTNQTDSNLSSFIEKLNEARRRYSNE